MARTQGSHADVTGPRIRAEALALFARDGYAAVSMRQIARAVGVQAGALYNYTPDKQSLLFDLMQSHMLSLLEAVPEFDGTPHGQLDGFVRFHLAFHQARGAEIFLSYNELRSLTPENFERIEALRGRYERILEEILRDGVAAGEMQVADVKVATRAVIAMLAGVATWYKPEGPLGLGAVQDLYSDMVRRLAGVI